MLDVLEAARKNSLTRDNPALSDLPAWFEQFRDHQRVAIREILCAYEEGVECVVLDAPTGSGKTIIGEAVRRILQLCGSPSRQTTYICSSKALQDQFVKDYPYAKVLKGRSNYPTTKFPERFGGKDGLSCADCTKSPGDADSCLWCDKVYECNYERAKHDALAGSLAVVNTSYFLSECNGPGRFSRGGFVIADESDCLEKELMGHVEVRISERRLKGYGLGVPKYVTKEDSWAEWAEEAYEAIHGSPPKGLNPTSLMDIREAQRHVRLVGKIDGLRKGLATGSWVYTGDREAVAFKPVMVSDLGQSRLWKHGDRWLLMSATVISADEMLESLGWDDEKSWRLVKVPSTFEPENRKVVVWPVASMTYKEKESSWPKLLDAVDFGCRRHTQDRVLIHSTSYDLTRYLYEGLSAAGLDEDRPLFAYYSADQKDLALNRFLTSPASILIAPSLDRGVDLPGDACRVQFICKVPFLNLKDKQVSARLYGGGRAGKIWYAVNAIRTIVQMTGRAVRSEEDYAVTYILDGQFVSNLWANHKRLVPEWWKEGLIWKMKGL